MGESDREPVSDSKLTGSRFAAYAASKAALNQALRHMAAELKRADDDTVVLALHPGEVAT